VSGVNSSQLETIDTGIILKITPTILGKNTILLDLELEQSDFIPTIEEDIVQAINKNTVKTSVVAFDGELISIGGIYVEKKSDFSSGIPYLKDIPIVGVLFGSENKSSSRIMIEFMIRPSIKDIEEKLTKIKKETYLFQNSDKSF
jgi:type II secretory pathway component GspD/PulD (secretin)